MNVVLVYLPKTRYYFIGMVSELTSEALSKVGLKAKVPQLVEYCGEVPKYEILDSNLTLEECKNRISQILDGIEHPEKCLNFPETEWPFGFKPFYVVQSKFQHLSGTRVMIFHRDNLILHESIGVSPEDLSRMVEPVIIGSFCTFQEAENKARSIINKKSRKRK